MLDEPFDAPLRRVREDGLAESSRDSSRDCRPIRTGLGALAAHPDESCGLRSCERAVGVAHEADRDDRCGERCHSDEGARASAHGRYGTTSSVRLAAAADERRAGLENAPVSPVKAAGRGDETKRAAENSPRASENSPPFPENWAAHEISRPGRSANPPRLAENSPSVGEDSPRVPENSPSPRRIGGGSRRILRRSRRIGGASRRILRPSRRLLPGAPPIFPSSRKFSGPLRQFSGARGEFSLRRSEFSEAAGELLEANPRTSLAPTTISFASARTRRRVHGTQHPREAVTPTNKTTRRVATSLDFPKKRTDLLLFATVVPPKMTNAPTFASLGSGSRVLAVFLLGFGVERHRSPQWRRSARRSRPKAEDVSAVRRHRRSPP